MAAEGAEAGELATLLSDQERERAVEVLNRAVADGRLTWAEHRDRVERAYAARTMAQLSPQLADLGETVGGKPAQRVRAVISKITRTPEPLRQIEATAVFGAVVLDLSGLPAGQQVHVEASSWCGKVVLVVGTDATVVDDGSAVLGKRTLPGPPVSNGGPVIRISGRSTLGHLRVRRAGSDRHV